MHSADTQNLELEKHADAWPRHGGKGRVLLVGINVPGHYSLPIRILALVAGREEHLRQQFDTRYVEVEHFEHRPPHPEVGKNEEYRDNLQRLCALITAWQPDLVAFSVNVWNRNACIRVADHIRQSRPDTVILAGGQEVTNSVVDYLATVPSLDYVIDGEGEIPFAQFLKAWDPERRALTDPHAVSGLRYRENGATRYTHPAELVASLDEVPSPILADLVPLSSQIGVMIEGARCCPHRCSFCFEGARKGKMRFASLERLASEMRHMVARGAWRFHIMDPILCNCEPSRLKALAELFDELNAGGRKILVSVESYAEHITDEVAPHLRPCLLIDIGLITTNARAAAAIHRRLSVEKFRAGIQRLNRVNARFNIYLLCGLPQETLATYLHGVRFALEQKPTCLFLNELLLLNGTELRRRAADFGYVFEKEPPYHIRRNPWMSERELIIAELLSKAIEQRHNLSMRAMRYDVLPWLGKTRRGERRRMKVVLGGGCSLRCPGCARRDVGPAALDQEHGGSVEAAPDVDLELMAGDGTPIEAALRASRRFVLAGVARVKVTAPAQVFSDRAEVETLVHHGIWHFETFLAPRTDGPHAPADPTPAPASAGLDWLRQVQAAQAPNPTRLHVEVAVVGPCTTPQQFRELIECALRHEPTIITIPEDIEQWGEAWVQEAAAVFDEAVARRCWLRLPRQLAGRVLGAVADVDQVVEALAALDLVGNEPNRPPCFLAQPGSETRDT
jgi:hypothetical protein